LGAAGTIVRLALSHILCDKWSKDATQNPNIRFSVFKMPDERPRKRFWPASANALSFHRVQESDGAFFESFTALAWKQENRRRRIASEVSKLWYRTVESNAD
jgi:hypothetical protein